MKSGFRVLSWVLVLGCCGTILPAADRVIDSRLNYRIIVPEKATAAEAYAAQELAGELRTIFTRPLVFSPGLEGPIDFLVGFGESAAASGFPDWRRNREHPGEFGLFRRGNQILFFGFDDPRVNPRSAKGQAGTLSSVYYFLTRKAQAAYFAPGKEGARYVTDPEIDLPAGVEWVRPAYRLRGLNLETKEYSQEEMAQYFRRLLGNVPDELTYTVNYQFLNRWPQRFEKEHPEWFGMHGGKRYTGSYPYHFPCLSNPGVLRQIVSDLDGELAGLPAGSRRVRLFCDAPYLRCECEQCARSPIALYCAEGDNSEEIYTYINKIAREVRKKYPDTVFFTQTKNNAYSTVPVTEPPERDIVIEVLTARPAVEDYSKSLDLMRSWRNAGALVLLKSYPRYPAWKNYPIMNPAFASDYFRTFQGVAEGPRQSDLRENVPFSFCALNQYIQARATFEGDLDAESAVADFCALAYPGAEAEMVEFYQVMENLLGRNSVWENPLYQSYRADKLAAPYAILTKARSKVTDDRYLAPLIRDFAAFKKASEAVYNVVAAHDRLLAAYREKQEKTVSDLNLPVGEIVGLELYPKNPTVDFQPGAVKLSNDGRALICDFSLLDDRPEAIKTACSENHVGPVWDDDCVEIMIAPETRNFPYLQIAVNALGVYRVCEHRTAGRQLFEVAEPALKTTARRAPNGWDVRVAIPLELVRKYLDEGRTGRLGIFRTAASRSPAQCSAINPAPGRGYHNPEEYARLVLAAGMEEDGE